jgi:hypothetical protein
MTTRVSGITGPHVRLLQERLQLHFLQLLLVGSNKCIKIPLKRVPSIKFLLSIDSRLFTLDSRLFTLDSRLFTLDSRIYSRLSTFTLDSRLLLSTFTLDSRPMLSTLDPRLLDTLDFSTISYSDGRRLRLFRVSMGWRKHTACVSLDESRTRCRTRCRTRSQI